MTVWQEKASGEIKRYARSGQLGAGRNAGQIYEFAKLLTPRRAASLPGLAERDADIRWWDFGNMTIYFRVRPSPITVLKVGRTQTAQQRSDCEQDARNRSRDS